MQPINRHEAFELASPFPYVLVVSLDRRDRPNIIGLSWWMFTSWNPLMIAISIGQGRYSHECILQHKEFVLCFPSKEQAKDAWLCGTKSGRDVDKFKETRFVPLQSKVVKPPLIRGVTVAYECQVRYDIVTGDHRVFIAEVAAIHGDHDRTSHLYSIHYRRLLGIDYTGHVTLDLEY